MNKRLCWNEIQEDFMLYLKLGRIHYNTDNVLIITNIKIFIWQIDVFFFFCLNLSFPIILLLQRIPYYG